MDRHLFNVRSGTAREAQKNVQGAKK